MRGHRSESVQALQSKRVRPDALGVVSAAFDIIPVANYQLSCLVTPEHRFNRILAAKHDIAAANRSCCTT